MPARPFELGMIRPTGSGADSPDRAPLRLPPHHLVTHGVCVGMTGSGKTGLALTLVEEALRSRVPVLLLDIKGDLPNLALLFGELAPAEFLPWVDEDAALREGVEPEAVAEDLAAKWKGGLASWGLGAADVKALRDAVHLRIITPGTTGAGEPLHVLSPLEQANTDLWETDEEGARESLSAALSLLLRMIERDPDPTRGREHVLLAHLAERRLRSGKPAGPEALLEDLQNPPIERVGALAIDDFFPVKERAELARDLNALVASPTFATWRQGSPLDVGSWMKPYRAPAAPGEKGAIKTPVTIVSVAHLDDDERMLVLSLVLEQTLAWVRSLSGTTDLRALVLFDEVFGFIPPHPKSPPTKRPLLALLKQARAFGVGVVLATQNPIDLDYKSLSNAGVWFIGRLQTDADRERVVEGLLGSDASPGGGESLTALDTEELGRIIRNLPPRTFFLRDVHAGAESTRLLETRWSLSWLRGPMTRLEIRRWYKGQGRELAEAKKEPAPRSAPREPPAPAVVPSPPSAKAAGERPEGWRTAFPHPPAAPVDAWIYAPHAAIVARASVSDARSGFLAERRVALLAPLDDAGVDVSRVVPTRFEDLHHGAAPGARFRPMGDALASPRAIKSAEKALREAALSAMKARVYSCPSLKLVSRDGEDEAAFRARIAGEARARGEREKASLTAKHEPKIQKLAAARDLAARSLADARAATNPVAVAAAAFGSRASGGVFGKIGAANAKASAKADKLEEKLAEAEAELREAVGRANAVIADVDRETESAIADITSKEIAPKADALVVETYAVVWLAR